MSALRRKDGSYRNTTGVFMGGEIHYVCFNDECCYFKKSWESLENQGIPGTGYRCRIDPRGACGPLAVWSSEALKDRICRDIQKASE